MRQIGVVGKFVEFFGSGVAKLSIADRATISNMCPEYGATVGFFPVDEQSLEYLKQTGEEKHEKNFIFCCIYFVLRSVSRVHRAYSYNTAVM